MGICSEEKSTNNSSNNNKSWNGDHNNTKDKTNINS